MQYELYIDVFFLVNFMMDYILLMLLRKMLACTATHARVIVGAAAGAVLTCVIIVVPFPWVFVKLLLFHGVVNVIMLKAGLCVEWGRPFVKAFLFLYVGSFLLGGIIGFLHQYIRTGSLFFALALLGYCLTSGIWSLIEALIQYNRTHCVAMLFWKERSCQVKTLIDTGNRLRDDKTGKPVSIIRPDVARRLGFFEIPESSKELHYIHFHSIGKSEGKLPVFEIDKMCFTKDKVEILRPLLAVCGDEMDSDSYGMILNPDIYFGGNGKI